MEKNNAENNHNKISLKNCFTFFLSFKTIIHVCGNWTCVAVKLSKYIVLQFIWKQ